ncbi:MAG: TonB-dependent receptor plug domain-containing protein, partial [Verrucomicrobia bacterium]|nr:TonB-dependent receptor plug domain-containing protein [Verrucomicrobiota bacterium]
MTQPLVTSAPVLATLATCAFVVPSAAAEGESRRFYALAPGDAAVTLKRFAEESGHQVVYLVDTVRGLRTNAVEGEFSAREALARLVANTGLTVREDEKSGALMVNRTAPKPAPRRAGPMTLLATWLAVVLAPAQPTHAADGTPLTGVVQGRVENAARGNYLGNVRVAVTGGGPETLTNGFGEYRLDRVPLGTRTLEASISGYVTQTTTVTVTAEPVTADFSLPAADAGRPDAKQTVVLEAFVVESQRTMSGSSVAINERRTAMNLKNVVAADEFGDSAEGNVAEFVKYLPGLSIDYNNADARYVSVRGLPSFGTAVMIDGNRMASAADNFSRGTEFNQVSLNNMAFIEVTKSPLPDTPSDTIGGAINLVLKSAFERSRPVFNYRTSLSGNFSRAAGMSLLKVGETPGPRGGVSTVMPGFDV